MTHGDSFAHGSQNNGGMLKLKSELQIAMSQGIPADRNTHWDLGTTG
jgi:hypothetical protein